MKRTRYLIPLVLVLLASGCGVRGSKSSAPDGDVMWQRYDDPLERAFTLEVPTGWTVKGGLFRLGYSDHRIMVDMTSPDGQSNIRLGDLAIPTYFLPNQFHREGEVYDLGAQAQGRVAKYRSGPEFANAYAKVRFASACQNLTPEPAILPILTHLDTPQGSSQASEGEATYTCGGAQGERVAYVYAQTALMSGLWQVSSLASYVAPQAQVGQIREIVLHSSKSFQLSSAWVQQQSQLDQQALVYQRQRQQARMRALSAQVAQFEAQMRAMQNQVSAFERGQAQRQQQFEAFDNVINGVTPTVDPYGNAYEVSTGPKSGYWRNPGTGQTVNSDTSPGPGWVPLKPRQ